MTGLLIWKIFWFEMASFILKIVFIKYFYKIWFLEIPFLSLDQIFEHFLAFYIFFSFLFLLLLLLFFVCFVVFFVFCFCFCVFFFSTFKDRCESAVKMVKKCNYLYVGDLLFGESFTKYYYIILHCHEIVVTMITSTENFHNLV